MREQDLYEDVAAWLATELQPHGETLTAVTANEPLSKWLDRWGVASRIPFAPVLDIEVDVAGVVQRKPDGPVSLYLVEVKVKKLNLAALSQLLGYCVVARPAAAWLLSPAGWSDSIERLVRNFGRRDILDFGTGRITIARWDINTRSVRPGDRLFD